MTIEKLTCHECGAWVVPATLSAERDEWKARAEAAERDADMWRGLEAEKASSLAAAERERDDSRKNADAWCKKQYAAESSLAAAIELLVWLEYAALYCDSEAAKKVRAFLVAQPAAAKDEP